MRDFDKQLSPYTFFNISNIFEADVPSFGPKFNYDSLFHDVFSDDDCLQTVTQNVIKELRSIFSRQNFASR